MKQLKRFIIDCYFFYKYRKTLSFSQYVKLIIADKKKKEGSPLSIFIKNYPHPFWIRPGTTDTKIFVTIFLKNDYPIIKNKTGTFIDAGANIGAATFFFKMHSPEIKIIAIEPDESNCELFERNMKPFSDVWLLKSALHNVEGKSFRIKNPEAPKYSYQMEEGESDLKTVSINGIMKKYNIERIDVAKIDIEGGEKELFEENLEWLNVCDILIIELHERYSPGCGTALLRAISKFDVTIVWRGENLIITKRVL
jgi:FkbM family methyltransferase